MPAQGGGTSGRWSLPVDSFDQLGADPTRTYRGRFLGRGAGGEVASESFLFNPCEKWLRGPGDRGSPFPPLIVLLSKVDAPLG